MSSKSTKIPRKLCSLFCYIVNRDDDVRIFHYCAALQQTTCSATVYSTCRMIAGTTLTTWQYDNFLRFDFSYLLLINPQKRKCLACNMHDTQLAAFIETESGSEEFDQFTGHNWLVFDAVSLASHISIRFLLFAPVCSHRQCMGKWLRASAIVDHFWFYYGEEKGRGSKTHFIGHPWQGNSTSERSLIHIEKRWVRVANVLPPNFKVETKKKKARTHALHAESNKTWTNATAHARRQSCLEYVHYTFSYHGLWVSSSPAECIETLLVYFKQ